MPEGGRRRTQTAPEGTVCDDLMKQFADARVYEHSADCTDADCDPDAYFLALFLPEIANPGKDKNSKTDDQVERWTAMSTVCCFTNWSEKCHLCAAMHPAFVVTFR